MRRKASVTALAVALLGSFALMPRADAVVLPGTNGSILIDVAGGLVSLDPLTGARQTLAATLAGDGGAHVSPNGQKVALVNPFFPGNVFIADFPSGNNRQQVTTSPTAVTVNWSPDSTRLVFECAAGLCTSAAVSNASVTILNQTTVGANTTGTRDITPDFSPNGAKVVFTDGFPATTGVFTVDLPNGGGRTKLLNSATGDSRPVTSPDGSKVWFDAGAGVISLPFPTGGSRTTLTGTLPGDIRIGPSPDGTKVSFETAGGIFTLNANGTGGRASVPGTLAGDQRPSWAGTAAVTPTNPNAPVFSAASGCGGAPILVRLLGTNAPVQVSASDADAGQQVTLAAQGLPAYVSFSGGAAGNPSTGTLTANPGADIIGFILGIFGPVAGGQVNATDNGTPSKSTPCSLNFRPGLF
jgi:Tol biopolymer transport system component